MLLLMTSVLFGEYSMVTHLKEIDNDRQHRLSSKHSMEGLSFEEKLFQLILVSSRIYELCDAETDKATLMLYIHDCTISLADILELLQTRPTKSCMIGFVEETRKSLDDIVSKDKLDTFARQYEHCKHLRGW